MSWFATLVVLFINHQRMLQLNPDDIEEFADAWKAEFNEDLSDGEARIQAIRLLELYYRLASQSTSSKEPTGDDTAK